MTNQNQNIYPKNGTVIWLYGLPGSGKTTVAKRLQNCFKQKYVNPVMLDGDELRTVLGKIQPDDYITKKARVETATIYCHLANLFAEQGHLVIVSTVSMFNEVFEWNKINLQSYIEIFLNPNLDTLLIRDKKNIYSKVFSEKKNISFEQICKKIYPGLTVSKAPDIVSSNETLLDLEAVIEQIMGRFDII